MVNLNEAKAKAERALYEYHSGWGGKDHRAALDDCGRVASGLAHAVIELLAAVEASTPPAEWEYEYRPVHVSGEEWAGRSQAQAAHVLAVFFGEEDGGPNGLTHINTYRRRPAGPWEQVTGDE